LRLRAPLTCGILFVLACALAAPGSGADDYLGDARTARAVAFGSPRSTLRECLQVLSETVEVSLTASPALSEEPLTGFVPSRPLRETMGALAELFDAGWTTLPGSPASYRLDPDPVKAKAAAAARAEERKRLIAGIDQVAANEMNAMRALERTPSVSAVGRVFALALWPHLPAADRARLLDGASVTIPIPEAKAEPLHRLILAAAKTEPLRLSGPLLATFDLDDRADTAFPSIRARATAMREDSITGAVGFYDPPAPSPKAVPADPPPDAPVFPEGIGDDGRFSGVRDQLVVELAQAGNLPILSRHRAYGGTAGAAAGGRPVPLVLAELARNCEGTAAVTSRGFYLIRSVTESLDRAGVAPASAVQAYLKQRPEPGKAVPLEALSALGALTPMQLSVLERSNVCSSEAGFAREAYAVLRFYRALTPRQRRAVFDDAGLQVAGLNHAQLHELLDQRMKRADFDIHEHVQAIRGLSFRFVERLGEENTLTLQAWRGGRLLSSSTVELPVVEAEDRPVARR
jgi:hypothetical protein